MANLFEFGFILEAVDRASATLRKVQTELNHFGETSKKVASLSELGNIGADVGLKAGAAAAAIALPLGEAVKGYEELQEQINNVAVATGGLSEAQRGALEGFVQQQAVITGFSAEDLTKSVYQGVSGFLTLNQAMAVSAEAAKVARSTQGDVADTTKLMTTMMINFSDKGKSAIENSTMLADKLTKVQSVGKWSNLTDLTVAMSYAAPAARQYGVSLDETLGALSALAASGYEASRAGTGFNEIIAMLAKKQHEYGYALVRTASGGLDLNDTLLKLRASFKGMDAVQVGTQLTKMFGPRAGAAIGLIFQHIKEFNEATAASAHSLGATDKAFAEFTAHGTLGFERLHAAVRNIADSIGGALAPNVEAAARALTRMALALEHFATAHPQLTKLAVDFAAISAGVLAVGGGLALGVSAFAGFVGFARGVRELASMLRLATVAQEAFNLAALANPWAIAILAIVAVGAALYELYEHWKAFHDLVNTVAAAVAGFFEALGPRVLAVAKIVWAAIKPENLFGKLVPEFFEWGAKLLLEFANGILSVINAPAKAVEAVVTRIAKYLPRLSPAEVGPLRHLDTLPFSETFAQSIKPAPVLEVMHEVAAAAREILPLVMMPLPEALRSPAMLPALSPPPTPMLSLPPTPPPVPVSVQPAMPEISTVLRTTSAVAAAMPALAMPALRPPAVEPKVTPPAQKGGGPTNIVVHYSPNISIHGGSREQREDWVTSARQHADTLVRIIRDKLIREERLRLE